VPVGFCHQQYSKDFVSLDHHVWIQCDAAAALDTVAALPVDYSGSHDGVGWMMTVQLQGSRMLQGFVFLTYKDQHDDDDDGDCDGKNISW